MRRLMGLAPRELMARFLVMAATVLVVGMLVVGLWVTTKIEEGVTDNAGAVTALYVDALVTPLVQDLANGEALSADHVEDLTRILNRGALREQIIRFKLWTPDGRIVFSDDPSLVGRVLGMGPGLEEALAGRVHASFDRTFHTGSVGAEDMPLLEVYSPVRSVDDGAVIGVAEFYTTAEALAGHLMNARMQTWVVVGLVSLGMFVVLSLVVAGGSRTIGRQRRSLDAQVAELSVLLQNNSSLTQRVEQANHRIAGLTEDNLRRISADLHDGPVQHLAFAALRLDRSGDERQEQVRRPIDEAMTEIRAICAGLALPELDDWPVETILRRLVAVQETRTGGKVALELAGDLPSMVSSAKICVYRFVQETLTNGAKHAPGARQAVRAGMYENMLEIEVSDDGPGFDAGRAGEGLGLVGLRERIAVLKGQMQVETRPGGGTRLVMRLPISGGVEQ